MMRKNSLIAAALSAALLMGCAQTAEPVAESLPAQPVVDIELDVEDARVSFLGPEGTYTQEACEVFFGGEGEYFSAGKASMFLMRLFPRLWRLLLTAKASLP